jgi:putative transport protein
MMDWIAQRLSTLPELTLFLCLALGYAFGSIKIKGFGLGTVVGTLVVALVLGQAGVQVDPFAKTIFFALFMFATGYEVGPEFFRGLRKGGLQMVTMSVTASLVGLGSALLMAKLFGFDPGLAAGLLSGALTQSAVVGTATDAVQRLSVDESTKALWISHIAIGDAATYVFGTAGVLILLTKVAPRMAGFNLRDACRKYEEELEGGEEGNFNSYVPIEVQALRLVEKKFIGKRAGETSDALSSDLGRVCIQQIRRGRKLFEPHRSEILQEGDVVVLTGRRKLLLDAQPQIGPQVVDNEAMDIPFEIVSVVVTSKRFAGNKLRELAKGVNPGGVHLRRILRQGLQLPALPSTRVERGDVLELIGRSDDIDRVGGQLGFVDRPGVNSDITFLGIAIALGALVGFITLSLGAIPVSLGTGGGVLVAGLVFGWLHSVRPRWGRIPSPAVWLMQNLGLNTFVALIGLGAAAHVVHALKESGVQLVLAGIFVSLSTNIASFLVGWYGFRMNGGILVGACAGAGTCTAALSGAVEEAQSRVPALGYTIPYALSNVLLTLWGPVIVVLMSR